MLKDMSMKTVYKNKQPLSITAQAPQRRRVLKDKQQECGV
jgi:hypothetical protein